MTRSEILKQRIGQLSAQITAWRRQLPEANYNEQANLCALIDLNEEMLAHTRHAHRRALRGEQQLCERCHHPICSERLAAVPEATLCIHCAREIEGRRHIPGVPITISTRNDVILTSP